MSDREIKISEETYEKLKDQLHEKEDFKYYDDYVLVRASDPGCFAGILKEKNDANRTVTLTNVRRLYYWDGAATCTQIAMEGVKKPENCKFTQEAIEEQIYTVIEIIKTTKEAQKNIREVWVWKL